jgi:hypothetical protein
MRAVRRTLLIVGLLALATFACGCSSLWYDLQPHRLQQLNRGPGMPTGPEAYS